MLRFKSVCSKWTLVLVVVVIIPYVFSRPQEISSSLVTSSTVKSILVENATESIRYRYRNLLNLSQNINPYLYYTPPPNRNISSNLLSQLNNFYYNNNLGIKNRHSRLQKSKVVKVDNNDIKIESTLPMKTKDYSSQKNAESKFAHNYNKKVSIKKIVTPWRDKTKYEDLDFSLETSTSEHDDTLLINSPTPDYISSTESIVDDSTEFFKSNKPQANKKTQQKNREKLKYNQRPSYSDGIKGHSNFVHIVDPYDLNTRPMYVMPTPTPTPIITNVGDPMPWRPQNAYSTYYKPSTQKPIAITRPVNSNYNYHHSVQNWPPYLSNDFEVTTFQPSTAYTERIVIRPEEYSASSDDCPTIYLTLNNTFQGQGKEICPDLNIAVNTNVINKNVVVQSEEEDTNSLFPDGEAFFAPLDSDSNSEDAEAESQNDYFASDASEEGHSEGDSAGEETELASYASSALSPSKKPNKGGDDFSLSSLMNYFKPAFNALGWIAAVNPLSFGLLSLFLAPFALFLAGTSSLSALFSPWDARKSPKVIHVYRPQWQWDNKIKTWHLNSFPDNRNWKPTRLFTTNIENKSKWNPSVLYDRLKQAIKDENTNLGNTKYTYKRRKREVWTFRVK